MLFDLPSGSIWSNLVASVIWGSFIAFGLWLVHTKTAKKLDEKFEEHVEAVKDMFNPETPGGITDALIVLQNGGNNDERPHKPVGS